MSTRLVKRTGLGSPEHLALGARELGTIQAMSHDEIHRRQTRKFPSVDSEELLEALSLRDSTGSPRAQLRIGAKWLVLAIEDLDEVIGYATITDGVSAFRWQRVILSAGRGDVINRIRYALKKEHVPYIPFADVTAEAEAIDRAAISGDHPIAPLLFGAADRALSEVKRLASTDGPDRARFNRRRPILERQIADAKGGTKVANWPLQKILIRALQRDASMKTICAAMGVGAPEDTPDTDTRGFGQMIGLIRPRKGKGRTNRIRTTTYERAVRMCCACRAEPSECGV